MAANNRFHVKEEPQNHSPFWRLPSQDTGRIVSMPQGFIAQLNKHNNCLLENVDSFIHFMKYGSFGLRSY
ncbi:hypothetical protein A4A49_21166 [Nicotiana attenuata]|uniref:Uncharacterized protein n=1 Tax=Nicotiana attenuata TaxID=49451 RepID=A0A1J6IE27_NICAT|nr:hypothetical protein A4A49_21166 [Nicotiana attenuata]